MCIKNNHWQGGVKSFSSQSWIFLYKTVHAWVFYFSYTVSLQRSNYNIFLTKSHFYQSVVTLNVVEHIQNNSKPLCLFPEWQIWMYSQIFWPHCIINFFFLNNTLLYVPVELILFYIVCILFFHISLRTFILVLSPHRQDIG